MTTHTTIPQGLAAAYSKCDVCPADIKVRILHRRDRTDLVFCGHHFELVEPYLPNAFKVVMDLRDNNGKSRL